MQRVQASQNLLPYWNCKLACAPVLLSPTKFQRKVQQLPNASWQSVTCSAMHWYACRQQDAGVASTAAIALIPTPTSASSPAAAVLPQQSYSEQPCTEQLYNDAWLRLWSLQQERCTMSAAKAVTLWNCCSHCRHSTVTV